MSSERFGLWDYLNEAAKRRKQYGQVSNTQEQDPYTPVATRESPNTGERGGSSGMSMVSGFTDLGDKLHRNSLLTAQTFESFENNRRDRRRQVEVDAENKRQFNESTRRLLNQKALDKLLTQRLLAGQGGGKVTRGRSFKDTVSAVLRGGSISGDTSE